MFTLSSQDHAPSASEHSGAPFHPQEVDRLGSLCALRFDPRDGDPLFDRIALHAAVLAGTPMGFFNAVRGEDQISVGRAGLVPDPIARAESICAHTIVNGGPLVVPDARLDARFAGLAAVKGEFGLRFYAGVPVRDAKGLPLGSLCVADTRPRELAPRELSGLERLAAVAEAGLEVRRVVVGLLGFGTTPFAAAVAYDALAEALDPVLAIAAGVGG